MRLESIFQGKRFIWLTIPEFRKSTQLQSREGTPSLWIHATLYRTHVNLKFGYPFARIRRPDPLGDDAKFTGSPSRILLIDFAAAASELDVNLRGLRDRSSRQETPLKNVFCDEQGRYRDDQKSMS